MVTQRSGPQGKPGEKWLRDLTPDNATAPAPDPTSDSVKARGGPPRVVRYGVEPSQLPIGWDEVP